MKKDNFFTGPVLVTGATGILGSWLTEELASAGSDIVTIMRDDVPTSNLFFSGTDKKIKIVRGSLADYSVVEHTLNEYEIETCFHLAAQTIVPTANRSPLSTFESNIKGTWNLTLRLSSEKARKTIGWKPEHSLESSIKETMAWYTNYFSTIYPK